MWCVQGSQEHQEDGAQHTSNFYSSAFAMVGAVLVGEISPMVKAAVVVGDDPKS